jgi:hypothetical protein
VRSHYHLNGTLSSCGAAYTRRYSQEIVCYTVHYPRKHNTNRSFPLLTSPLPPPHKHLHLRRQQRRLPQPLPNHNPHHLPGLPLAARPNLHPHPNPRRFLRSSPSLRSPPQQHPLPRQRRLDPSLHRRKHVHAASRLDPPVHSVLRRTARQRGSDLHDNGSRRQREFTAWSRNARSDNRACSNSNKHGPLLPNARLL